MMTFGQRIKVTTGDIEVGGFATPEEAAEEAVKMAISRGWKPRLAWWQFWLPKAPNAECLDAYISQTILDEMMGSVPYKDPK